MKPKKPKRIIIQYGNGKNGWLRHPLFKNTEYRVLKARGATQRKKQANIPAALSSVARSAESVAKCLSCLKASCKGVTDAVTDFRAMAIQRAKDNGYLVELPTLAEYNQIQALAKESGYAEICPPIYASPGAARFVGYHFTGAKLTELNTPSGLFTLSPNGNLIKL